LGSWKVADAEKGFVIATERPAITGERQLPEIKGKTEGSEKTAGMEFAQHGLDHW